MVKMSKENLDWRKKQKRGAIMKPKTFKKIEQKSEAEGHSAKIAKEIAGSAYWTTEKSKFKKS